MTLDTSLTRENQGYAFPYDSKIDKVSNDEVIGILDTKWSSVLIMDGHISIYKW